MNELIITDIDAHMRAIPASPEKDQVSFLQLFFPDLLPYRELLSGGPRKLDIENLIDFSDKSRAVNPL